MKLLVSVRDAAEAETALAGGAALIDAKEPSAGPLGAVKPAMLAAIAAVVGGRVPVSAAGGELLEPPELDAPQFDGQLPRISLMKYGLAGWARRDWPSAWRTVRERLPANVGLVAVAYADAERCVAPAVAEVVAFALAERPAALLIDTAVKDGRGLSDIFAIEEVASIVNQCRAVGVPVALAGSLTVASIEQLRPVRPDWFAVRGAACDGGRGGRVSRQRVLELAQRLGR